MLDVFVCEVALVEQEIVVELASLMLARVHSKNNRNTYQATERLLDQLVVRSVEDVVISVVQGVFVTLLLTRQLILFLESYSLLLNVP